VFFSRRRYHSHKLGYVFFAPTHIMPWLISLQTVQVLSVSR
jgi:hypothetical protein